MVRPLLPGIKRLSFILHTYPFILAEITFCSFCHSSDLIEDPRIWLKFWRISISTIWEPQSLTSRTLSRLAKESFVPKSPSRNFNSATITPWIDTSSVYSFSAFYDAEDGEFEWVHVDTENAKAALTAMLRNAIVKRLNFYTGYEARTCPLTRKSFYGSTACGSTWNHQLANTQSSLC